METNHINFDFNKSLERIDSIVNDSATYEESDDIPSVDDLTYTNGNYVKCAAFFIDLRGSTDLIKNEGRKSNTLARIYRAYISEIVAIVNSFETCKEVNIVGDCVSAVFSGKTDTSNSPVIEVLQAASMSNAMMDVLNVNYKKRYENLSEIKAGIGISFGRALVIKAGFSGSGIKDLVYMGDVVNKASKMCDLAYKEYDSPICVTEEVYNNANFIANNETNATYQDFLSHKINPKYGTIYVGDIVRIDMKNWAFNNS